ncbi:hypothetical protein HYY75_11710 [bacterium]|nr:hypothetical protein [bacterium]
MIQNSRQKIRPWKKLGTSAEQFRFLEVRMRVCEDVDAILEQCALEHKDLGGAIDIIFKCLADHLKPEAMFVQTQNEDLKRTVFSHKLSEEMLKGKIQDLIDVTKATFFSSPPHEWYIIPIDMAGEIIGTFGMAFSKDRDQKQELVFDLMTAVLEEMDNYFYSIQDSRRKHLAILEIQQCLKTEILTAAVDKAVAALEGFVPIQDLLLLYIDEGECGDSSIQYLLYRDCQKLYDSLYNQSPELEKALKSGPRILEKDNKDLELFFPHDSSTEIILFDGIVSENPVGKMVIRPYDGIGFSMTSRELIQVFSGALQQRLIDFKREKNSLLRTFSKKVTEKMVGIPGHSTKYLSFREAEIGILFADFSCFSKLCDQVLKTSGRIERFIEGWKSGLILKLFGHEGAFDKMLGASFIGVFGPPFYQFSRYETATKLLTASREMIFFTETFLKCEENSDIRKVESFFDFGVTIALNLCKSNIGFIGSDQNLSVIGSGMENLVLLQNISKKGEILATSSVIEAFEIGKTSNLELKGPMTILSKYPQEEITYYKIVK